MISRPLRRTQLSTSIESADKESLIQDLDIAVRKIEDNFNPGFSATLRRFFKEPKKIVLRKVLIGILKQKYRVMVKGSTFYGAPLYTDNFAHTLWFNGIVESDPEIRLAKYLIRSIVPSDVFFDVGSNYGLFAVLVSDIGTPVHAFEPSRAIFKILTKNARGRKNIRANNAAVYSQSGFVTFFDSSGADSTTDPRFVNKINRNIKKTQVAAITLDDYCKQERVIPTIIKIDVEGAEKEVVAGMRDILQKYSPVIILEMMKSDTIDYLEAANILITAGYKSFSITNAGYLLLNESVSLPTDMHDNIVFKK